MLNDIAPHFFSILEQMYRGSANSQYETTLQRIPVDTHTLREKFRFHLSACALGLIEDRFDEIRAELDILENIAEKGHIATIGHSAKYGPWTTGPWSGRFHNILKLRLMLDIDHLPVVYPIPYNGAAYTYTTEYGDGDRAVLRIPYIYFTDYGVVYTIRAMPYTIQDRTCNIHPFEATQSYESIAKGELPFFMTSEMYEKYEQPN